MQFNRVHRYPPLTFVFGAADTEKTLPFPIEGAIRTLHLRVPAGLSATLAILDQDNFEIYSSGPQNAGNYNLKPGNEVVLVTGPCSIKVTLEAAPGGSGATIIAVPWYFGQRVSW